VASRTKSVERSDERVLGRLANDVRTTRRRLRRASATEKLMRGELTAERQAALETRRRRFVCTILPRVARVVGCSGDVSIRNASDATVCVGPVASPGSVARRGKGAKLHETFCRTKNDAILTNVSGFMGSFMADPCLKFGGDARKGLRNYRGLTPGGAFPPKKKIQRT